MMNEMALVMICRAVWWVVDGILEWLTYVVQYGFPLYNLFLFAFAFYCIHDEIDIYLNEVQDLYRCDCRVAGLGTPNVSFNCTSAYTMSVFTLGKRPENLESGVIRFDCSKAIEPLEMADFVFEDAQTIVQEEIERIYTAKNDTTEENWWLAFLNDAQYACKFWLNEEEYRLENS